MKKLRIITYDITLTQIINQTYKKQKKSIQSHKKKMPSPQKQKNITSLSFSQQPLAKEDQKKHQRRFHSHEHKIKVDEQKTLQQKVSLNKMLSKSIDEHNQTNHARNKPYQWELVLIDQKRTITGIKVRIKCRMLPSQLYVVIRLSFTLEYFRLDGKMQEETVFIELDEINFDINKTEKRQFQTELEKMIKPVLSRTLYAEDNEENKWVRQLFDVVESILQVRQYRKRQKKVSESLNRKQILTKYMLYHPPVCFTWSPKGLFCLTQNKVPANKCSFIGNSLSFKLNIEVPKVSHLNTVNEQELAQSTQQSSTQLSLFNWDMSEELQLFALSSYKRQLSSYYKDNTRKELESRKKFSSTNNLNSPAHCHHISNGSTNTLKTIDTMVLENTKHMTVTMRKIYQRYFSSRNQFQFQMARGEKLNVYFILGENRRNQDQMIYLMEKISIDRLRPPIEVILTTMLSSHPNLLTTHQGQSLDRIKYFVISQLFKQSTSKSSTSTSPSTCAFSLSDSLKAMMVENEYHCLQLERYFRNCFRQVGLNNAQSKFNIYYLGSYMHFDQCKAEKILMKLLQQFEYHYQLNLKNQKEVKFILQSKYLPRIKKHIKIKNVVKFPPLKQDWLLSEDNRKQFIQTILPLLIIRDRNYQDFYYKQLQRIITTNQKILKFYKNLSQIIKKLEEEKHDFIKNLVNQFLTYEKEKKQKEHLNDVRREFVVYCQKCQKPNRTFQIADAEKLRICNRCSETNNKKN